MLGGGRLRLCRDLAAQRLRREHFGLGAQRQPLQACEARGFKRDTRALPSGPRVRAGARLERYRSARVHITQPGQTERRQGHIRHLGLSVGFMSVLLFTRHEVPGWAALRVGEDGTAPLSAMLKDAIAIDGQRRRCAAGEQPVAVIDLDPKGGVFAPPAKPDQQPGLALGLAVLRDAGVVITWLSDLSVNQSGALRTALEQSGLDPRGEDIISLRRETDDRKQQRKDNLAGITCIIAIAGDERADFDERFIYLRSPAAGAELEPIIGNGWFLIEPVFPEQGKAGQ